MAAGRTAGAAPRGARMGMQDREWYREHAAERRAEGRRAEGRRRAWGPRRLSAAACATLALVAMPRVSLPEMAARMWATPRAGDAGPDDGFPRTDEVAEGVGVPAAYRTNTITVMGDFGGASARMVVRVRHRPDGWLLGTGYLRPGGRLVFRVPPGAYDLGTATGGRWVGADALFGPRTAYRVSWVPLTVSRTASGTTDQVVWMRGAVGGNLPFAPSDAF